MIVAGIKHCEAEYACLNEDFTLSKSVHRVLVATGKYVLWDFMINQVLRRCRLSWDTGDWGVDCFSNYFRPPKWV